MARFRGTLQGSRGAASRLGHSGLTVTANGWDVGVRVDARPGHDDCDEFVIVATGGSNGGSSRVIGRVRLVAGIPTFVAF